MAGQVVARFRFFTTHEDETMAALQQSEIAVNGAAYSSRFGEGKPGVRAATPAARLDAAVGVHGSVPG